MAIARDEPDNDEPDRDEPSRDHPGHDAVGASRDRVRAGRATAARTVDVLSGLGQQSARRAVDRARRVRASLLIACQSGIAAGIAWYVAHDLIGHRFPFFAPIAAVVVLAAAVGQRLRRAVELVAGVTIGILVGDVLIYFIGTGLWQIASVVILAILAAVFLGGGSTVMGQAASSAVLVATLAPPTSGIYYGRFVDSLVGGVTGVLVMALLLPINPLTTVQKATNPGLDLLADGLDAVADALIERDLGKARIALERMRSSEPVLIRFRDALTLATETASLAPARWRTRGPLAQYAGAIIHIGRAIRDGQVLARRAVSALSDGEAIIDDLAESLGTLAHATRTLRKELSEAVEPVRAGELALTAVGQAIAAYRAGLGFSGDVVVAQVRSIATDLLRAAGMDDTTSVRAVRQAVGRLAR